MLVTSAFSLTATSLLTNRSLLSHVHAPTTFVTSDVSAQLLILNTASTIATSLVRSKLDYCNSLYLNLPAYHSSNSRSFKTTWPEQSHLNANLTASPLHSAHFTSPAPSNGLGLLALSRQQFLAQLKTHLFHQSFPPGSQ
jgi:hypothetical protein